jgi:methionyl-tRNA formyltransferase
MSYKGLYFLEKIDKNYLKLVKEVVISEDEAVINDYKKEIVIFCKKNEINLIERSKLKKIDTEYCFAISWRWMINHPARKLIIFHDSLLPKYRGFSPLVSALINGETEIGVSAIYGDINYDCGEIIKQEKIRIAYPIKINQAIELVSELYVRIGNDIFKKLLLNKNLNSVRQKNDEATYSLWRDAADYFIDWDQDSRVIKRMIDAVGFPYKNATTKINNQVIEVIDADIIEDRHIINRDCGKVIFWEDGMPVVVCKKGLIIIKKSNIIGSNESLSSLNKFRLRFMS